MRAWLMHDYKGVDGLRLADVPEPSLAPGEVHFKVHYAGLNPADRYLAEKQYPARPTLPHILGRDAVGTVVRVAPEVTQLRPGDRRALLRGEVGINKPGTFADLVAVPAESLIEFPQQWTEQESAGATLVYLTAYQALTMWGPLPQNAVILVTGASGGVGVASVQLAAAMKFQVIALSRSAQKGKRLLELGASLVFDPSDSGWRHAVKAKLGSNRVDLAIDNVGGKLFPEVIDTLGDFGKVSVVGRLAGPVPNFNTATLFFRRLRIGGVAVNTYSNTGSRQAWKHVLELLASRNARPLVDSVYDFDQLKEAFARLAEGPLGKVLLRVNGQ